VLGVTRSPFATPFRFKPGCSRPRCTHTCFNCFRDTHISVASATTMRRTTLGPIGSRMNRRPSMSRKVSARPRMSMGAMQKPKTVIDRRQSTQPRRRSSVASRCVCNSHTCTPVDVPDSLTRWSIRRSSVYGSSSAKDTRPLKDKSFQHQCIKMLIQFLTERGYDQPISLKLLTRPTGRDFYNIAEFLVKCIDPRFTFKVR